MKKTAVAYLGESDGLWRLIDEGLQCLDEGRSLPSIWYTSAAIYQAEVEKIFKRSWQYACRVSDLKAAGDFFSGVVAGLPYVVTRAEDGLHAFLNVCRHRFHHVAQGCGNARTLQCAYHGWTYDLCGNLIGIPRGMELKTDGPHPFCKETTRLIPFSVETWGHLVFVNPDPKAQPLAQTLGPVREISEARGLQMDLPRAGRDEMVVDCNWKTFVDNVLECYHCPTVHPILARTHDVQHAKYEYYGFAGAQVIEARPSVKDKAGPDTHDHYAAYVFPGLWLSGRAGESFFLLITDPIDAKRTRVTKEYYLPPGMPEEEVASRIATFRRVIGEDVGVVLSTQRGHDTGMVPPGYLAQNIEVPVRHFQGLILDMLRTGDNELPLAAMGRVTKN